MEISDCKRARLYGESDAESSSARQCAGVDRLGDTAAGMAREMQLLALDIETSTNISAQAAAERTGQLLNYVRAQCLAATKEQRCECCWMIEDCIENFVRRIGLLSEEYARLSWRPRNSTDTSFKLWKVVWKPC